MYFIKKPLSLIFILTTFLLATNAFAMDTKFTDIPKEARCLTVRQASYQQCLEDNAPITLHKTLANLELVCKEWQVLIHDEMKLNSPSWKAWYGVVGHEDIYQQFLNGTLIYRPNLYRPNAQIDEGMITLKISDLLNPLEGAFDLSKCGDVGQYLSISAGFHKGMEAENSDKVQIWLVPRFMIAKKLNSSASHIQSIMDDWKEETAPIGILWNWGGWNDLSWYQYLTNEGINVISSKNLFQNWWQARRASMHAQHPPSPQVQATYRFRQLYFTFICEPK